MPQNFYPRKNGTLITVQKDENIREMTFSFSYVNEARTNLMEFYIEYKPLYKKDNLYVNVTPYFEILPLCENPTRKNKQLVIYHYSNGAALHRGMQQSELEIAVHYLKENLPFKSKAKFNPEILLKRYHENRFNVNIYNSYFNEDSQILKIIGLPIILPDDAFQSPMLRHGEYAGNETYFISLNSKFNYIFKRDWINDVTYFATPDEVTQIVKNMYNEFSPEGIAHFGIDTLKQRYSSWMQSLNKPLKRGKTPYPNKSNQRQMD